MAVRASHEVVVEASPEDILDVLADVESLPSWSSVYRRTTVLERYPDGRPHRVEATVRLMGVTDTEILEYHWGHRWVVWDAENTLQQRGQHVEYNLTPEGDRTRVRFYVIVDPSAPLPRFLVRRAKKIVVYSATERLRARVMSKNRGE